MMWIQCCLLLAFFCVASANYGAKLSEGTEKKVLKVLFKLLKIDADPSTCISETTGVSNNIKDFSSEYDAKNYEAALGSLSNVFSGLSSSIGDCGLPQVSKKLNAAALATKFAKIGTKMNDLDTLVIGASELKDDVENIVTAIKADNADDIGNALGSFLNDWTQVTGGCGDHKGCKLVGGVLHIIQEVAKDLGPCEDAILPAVSKMEGAVSSFKSKDYKKAISDLASSLEDVSVALKNDSCGLTRIGDLIGKLSPKLAAAIVKIDDSKAVSIIVESADIFDDVYQLIEAIEKGDWTTIGEELANLLRVLRASSCETKACIILEGIMASAQQELENFDQCMGDADKAWGGFESAMAEFKNKDYARGIKDISGAFVTIAHAVKDCNVEGVATVAENMFNKINSATVANEIGTVTQLLVQGADVTLEINRAVLDFGGKDWAGFGSDLGNLADFLASTKCQSVTCKIVEGLLNAAGVAFEDLKGCEDDLKGAIAKYTQGAQLMEQKNYKSAIKTWSQALSETGAAINDCGLKKELGFIQQEANMLGFANVTVHTGFIDKIEQDFSVLVHGFDYVGDLVSVMGDIKGHDYHAAGADLHNVVSDMSSWTGRFACTSDLCYTIMGVLQFVGDMSGSIKLCESDFKEAWHDFGGAVHAFHDSHKNIIFHFKHDKNEIKAGLGLLGDGFKKIAAGVSDCHLQEFAELLEKLATKLGIAPEISFFEELLHIVINGVKIEEEIGSACSDYSKDNWPGFGFNLAKLIKTLL